MSKIFIYNALTRRKEEFKPLKSGQAGIYTCGPTVYNYAHIGNLRTYLFEDFLRRVLVYNGLKVNHVMNITDVGHLIGDQDLGEDKMEAGAKREGKSAWEIADFYTQAFQEDIARLNILAPAIWCKATDNIPEQIELISRLEKKGYTYQTRDGIYFDTAKFSDYNKLSHLPLEELREGARVEKNPDKKNPTDFALWKFSSADIKRQMEWGSPWGKGFPGWHIECSAMSLKYLKGQLDIHCGGIDHINIHHTNEIAQSEAATGRPFFNYWLHGAFLNISGGKKMAKSGNNFLTLSKALIDKGLDPLAYRFAACQVHYRKPMEYSEEILRQAEQGLIKLRTQVGALRAVVGQAEDKNLNFFRKSEVSARLALVSKEKIDSVLKDKFIKAINDDLNLPKALAVLSAALKSRLVAENKLATVLDFDRVLGLNLEQAGGENKLRPLDVGGEVAKLSATREAARTVKNWVEADRLRLAIEALGFLLEDAPTGPVLKRKK